jgi:hypothetical protein
MDLGTERARLAQWSAFSSRSKDGARFVSCRPSGSRTKSSGQKTDSRWCDGEAVLRPLWVQAGPARQHAQAGERFRKFKTSKKYASSQRTVVVWGWGVSVALHAISWVFRLKIKCGTKEEKTGAPRRTEIAHCRLASCWDG